MFRCEEFFNIVLRELKSLGVEIIFKKTFQDNVTAIGQYAIENGVASGMELSAGDAGFQIGVRFSGETPVALALQQKIKEKFITRYIRTYEEIDSSSPGTIALNIFRAVKCYVEWRQQTGETDLAITEQINKTVRVLDCPV